MPQLSVQWQICNDTVHMLQKLWHLEHLIKRVFGVWCGKCAKYLAFGTFTTSAVDALSERTYYIMDKIQLT